MAAAPTIWRNPFLPTNQALHTHAKWYRLLLATHDGFASQTTEPELLMSDAVDDTPSRGKASGKSLARRRGPSLGAAFLEGIASPVLGFGDTEHTRVPPFACPPIRLC